MTQKFCVNIITAKPLKIWSAESISKVHMYCTVHHSCCLYDVHTVNSLVGIQQSATVQVPASIQNVGNP
jgi:hypothetical protein